MNYEEDSNINICSMCGCIIQNIGDCGEFGNPDCPLFGIGRDEYEKRFTNKGENYEA